MTITIRRAATALGPAAALWLAATKASAPAYASGWQSAVVEALMSWAACSKEQADHLARHDRAPSTGEAAPAEAFLAASQSAAAGPNAGVAFLSVCFDTSNVCFAE